MAFVERYGEEVGKFREKLKGDAAGWVVGVAKEEEKMLIADMVFGLNKPRGLGDGKRVSIIMASSLLEVVVVVVVVVVDGKAMLLAVVRGMEAVEVAAEVPKTPLKSNVF